MDSKVVLRNESSSNKLTGKQTEILRYLDSLDYGTGVDLYRLSESLGCHPSTIKKHLTGLMPLVKNIKHIPGKAGTRSQIALSKPKRGDKVFLSFGKKDYVRAMSISEYPLDTLMGTSEMAKKARKGILEYVRGEQPDVIFVDGLNQRIRYPEQYLEGVLDSTPKETFMEVPFQIAGEFLTELKKASCFSEVHYVLSDADFDNIRRLTKYRALQKRAVAGDRLKRLKDEIKSLKRDIKGKKKQGKGIKKISQKLERLVEDADELSGDVRMPPAESPEWNEIKREVSEEYVERLREVAPGINISMSDAITVANGFTFHYSHNFNSASDLPLSSRTNKLLAYINQKYMGLKPGEKLPDFIVESGHHAESIAHPFRHGENNSYSFVVSGMVMEDQNVVKDLRDKDLVPEVLQGKHNKIEACKRQQKKMPSPGIVMFGRDEEGYYCENYSLGHLAKVGEGKVNIQDMDYREVDLFSDIHVGKGAVDYDCLRTALRRMEDNIDRCVKENISAPLLVISNESLQGRNYRTMVVETKSRTPEELRKILEEAGRRSGGNLGEVINTAIRERERLNEPRIMTQLDWYHDLTNAVVLKTLLHNEDDPSVVINEATHIAHTVGEWGINEVELQTLGFRQFDAFIPILEKEGIVEKGSLPRLSNRIRGIDEGGSGYGRFETKLGDVNYTFSTCHKPGSANPSSNIPRKHMLRATNMADDADIITSSHLHTPFSFTMGRAGLNDIVLFAKGATFNMYDSYGKAGGWQPAGVGYQRLFIPTNKGGKGAYKVHFVMSDVLSKKSS